MNDYLAKPTPGVKHDSGTNCAEGASEDSLQMQAFFSMVEESAGADVAQEIRDVARENLPLQAAALEGAAEQRDRQACAAAAHKLKGAARSLGLMGIGDACLAIEDAARDGDLPRMSELTRALMERLGRLSAELSNH